MRATGASLRDLLLEYAGEDEDLSDPELQLLQFVYETMRDECSVTMEKVMHLALKFIDTAADMDMDTHCDVEDEIETRIQDWGDGMRYAKNQYQTEI